MGVTSGQDRSFRTASCGVAPGDAGGPCPPGAYATRTKSRGHPFETGCLRIGWLQAGIPEPQAPRSPMQRPRSRRGGGTAPVTPRFVGMPRERCVRISVTNPVIPAQAGISGEGIPRSHPYTVIASRTRSNPSPDHRQSQPAGLDRHGADAPRDDDRWGRIQPPQHLHRHPGPVPGSTPRLGHTLPVDAGTSPA